MELEIIKDFKKSHPEIDSSKRKEMLKIFSLILFGSYIFSLFFLMIGAIYTKGEHSYMYSTIGFVCFVIMLDVCIFFHKFKFNDNTSDELKYNYRSHVIFGITVFFNVLAYCLNISILYYLGIFLLAFSLLIIDLSMSEVIGFYRRKMDQYKIISLFYEWRKSFGWKLCYWIYILKIYLKVNCKKKSDYRDYFLLSRVIKNSFKKEKVLDVGNVGIFLEHLKDLEASKMMVYNNLFNLYPSMLHLSYRRKIINKKINSQSNKFVDDYIEQNQFMVDLSFIYAARLYGNQEEMDRVKKDLLNIKAWEPNFISLLILNKYPVNRILFVQDYILSENEFEALFLLERELAKKVEEIENDNLINTWQYQTIRKLTKRINKKEIEDIWKESFENTDMGYFIHSIINILNDLYIIDVGLFNERDVILWVKILTSLEKLYHFDRFLVESISNKEWSYINQIDFDISKNLKELMSKVLLHDELEQTIPLVKDMKETVKKF